MNQIQFNIIAVFSTRRTATFSEIHKAIDIRSNLLDYHIQQLVSDGLLTKHEREYTLTAQGESLISKLSHVKGTESGPLSVVVVIARYNNMLYFIKRNKRPYQGFWGMPGGKIRISESAMEAGIREATEELGVSCIPVRVCGVVHEQVRQNGLFIHAFMLWVVEVELTCVAHVEHIEGRIQGFSQLPQDIIPSDKLMIIAAQGSFFVKHIVIEQQNDVIVDMVVTDVL